MFFCYLSNEHVHNYDAWFINKFKNLKQTRISPYPLHYYNDHIEFIPFF